MTSYVVGLTLSSARSAPVRDVPSPAVLIPLLLASLAVMLWRLQRGRRFTWPRAGVGALASTYGVAVVFRFR